MQNDHLLIKKGLFEQKRIKRTLFYKFSVDSFKRLPIIRLHLLRRTQQVRETDG